MDEGKRSFGVIEIRKSGQKNKSGSLKKTKSHNGRFISKTPDGAARKVFTQACHAKKIHGQCSLDVTVKETTQGSSGKTYSYRLKRVKLAKPLVISRGGNDITIEYETKVTSLN